MTANPVAKFTEVFTSLRSNGLLLVTDQAFPSVATLVTGTSIRGSWWSHPMAHTIFAVNEMLEDHKDVLITKLLCGKVTFVHRKLWPQIYAVANACEDWQTRGLSTAAKALFKRVQSDGSLDTSQLPAVHRKKAGTLARELEIKLLIYSKQIHTQSGSHAKIIETWNHWADRVRLKNRLLEPQSARRSLKKLTDKLNMEFDSEVRLPWED